MYRRRRGKGGGGGATTTTRPGQHPLHHVEPKGQELKGRGAGGGAAQKVGTHVVSYDDVRTRVKLSAAPWYGMMILIPNFEPQRQDTAQKVRT